MVLMNYSMILYRAQNIFEVEPNFMANFMNKELRIDGFIKHLGGRSWPDLVKQEQNCIKYVNPSQVASPSK